MNPLALVQFGAEIAAAVETAKRSNTGSLIYFIEL